MREEDKLKSSNGESGETTVNRRSLLKIGAIFAGMITIGSSEDGYLSQAVLGSRLDSDAGTKPQVESDTLNISTGSTITVGSTLRPTYAPARTVTESEPNDGKHQATKVDFGDTVTGALTQADSDWYAVTVNSGEEIEIIFERSTINGVTTVVLYDTNGDLINLRYVGTDSPSGFIEQAEMSGNHFIQVVDTQASDGDYMLTIEAAGGEETATTTPTSTPTPTSTSSNLTIKDGDVHSISNSVYESIVWEATGRLIVKNGAGVKLGETA